MAYQERKKLKEEAMRIIEDDLLSIEMQNKYPSHYRRELSYQLTKTSKEFTVGAANALIYSFAAICFVLPLILPEYQIAYAFGLALLLSTLTQSVLAKLAAVIFTVIYFVLFQLAGWYFSINQVWDFLWSINTISLVPVLVGTIMAILAMGSGVACGLANNTRYAGLWLIALALIISTADALIAMFMFEYTEVLQIFLVHMAIYIVALLIAWALFYIPFRAARFLIDAVAGEEE